MDYGKAYKESFEAAKGLHEAGNALTKKQMEIVFPQLAESEDERIRTRFIEYFQGFLEGNEDCYKDGGYVRWEGLDVKSILAYLEKQKEQKPAEINLKALLTADRLASAEMTGRLKERSEILENPDKYGLQKPAEWSEEDEETLKDIIAGLEATKQLTYKHEPSGRACYNRWIAWLKSLRNRVGKESLQPHWKPTEEQMKALLSAEGISRASGYPDNAKVLASLYEQLKKLM